MARKLFGTLNFAGIVGRGENPNGIVQQTSNGTWINREGADGDDFIWGVPADGSRWNKTEPKRTLADRDVPRPVSIVATPRRK
jgi:hypothetical protein